MKKEKGTQNQDAVKKSPMDVAVGEIQQDFDDQIKQIEQEKLGVGTKIEEMEITRLKNMYRFNGANVFGMVKKSMSFLKNHPTLAVCLGIAGIAIVGSLMHPVIAVIGMVAAMGLVAVILNCKS